MTLDEFAARPADDGDDEDALNTEIDIDALDQVSGGMVPNLTVA